MSKERYLDNIQQIVHLSAQIDPTADVTHKFMFGGVGLYTRGLIFATLISDADHVWLSLKLPKDGRESLTTGETIPEAPGGSSYATLPLSMWSDDAQMIEWVERSLHFTWANAAKKKKKT